LCVLFIVGCTTNIKNSNDEVTFNLKHSYYKDYETKLSSHTEQNILLLFQPLPGKIFGTPTLEYLYQTKLKDSSEFLLILPSNIDLLAETFENDALTIKPKSTKILRLGTFHYLARYNDLVGGGSFIENDTGKDLLLVYFSNAIKITGTVYEGNESFKHDIIVKKPGWHWLEATETFEGNYKIKKYTGNVNNIEFISYIKDS